MTLYEQADELDRVRATDCSGRGIVANYAEPDYGGIHPYVHGYERQDFGVYKVISKRQLHVTGLLTLSKCGEAFRRRNIEQEHTPMGASQAIGRAVHRSVQQDLQHKIDSQALLGLEEVEDIARDTLVHEWEGVERTPEDEDEEMEFSRDRAIDRSVVLARFHHQEVAPRVAPTHVERSWTLDISGISLQLAGTIDLQEGTRRLGDWKTSAKSPAKNLAAGSLQLTTYALAAMAHDGAIPERVGLDYLVCTPRRQETKLIQLESVRTRESFNPLLERIAQAERTIEAGIFTPADPNHWGCSKRWCSFWSTCRFAVRPVTVSVIK